MEEKQVLVNESSLVNIADALRDKLGDTKTVPSVVQNPLPLVQKTPNATGHDNLGSMASNSTTTYTIHTIPGAKSILIKCSCHLNSSSCDLMAASGKQDSFNYGTDLFDSVYITTRPQYRESTFEGTDTVTIKAYYQMAYYIEICGLDADGNEMPYYETESEVEVANTFKPNEMAEAITNLPFGGASVDFANLKSVSYTGDYGSNFIPIEEYSALPQDFGFPAFVYVYGVEGTILASNLAYSKGLSGVAMLYTDENNKVKVKPLIDASAHESYQPFTEAAEYHYINRRITAKNSTTYFRGKAKNSVFNITVFYTPKA